MNYLAHSFLSFTDGQIAGQFLEDFIRNKDRFLLPKEIQDGITLHRAIDTFTDSHPVIHEAKKVFSPLVRLYSGAFIDVCMDYFLANDLTLNSLEGWKEHSLKTYKILHQYEYWFPENFKLMLSNMEKDDWLYNYREDRGIRFSIQNVLNKAKYLDKDLPVFEVFFNNKEILQKYYDQFFPDLIEFAKQTNDQLKEKL
ncbi:ACP phosphodiesterase [Chryseobacterium sp.]|uniref:acyl carrier protein phosphodiesterase n=1 Tax=Chryseobacterium sp. TaxID=1871047 RepID=UPI0025C16EB2|nr:ACP phosphodiesterase [Chryseobacterium sp.]